MPNYTNFADSFFSPEMWGAGRELWPYAIVGMYVVVSIVIVSLLHRFADIATTVLVGLFLLAFGVLGSDLARVLTNNRIAQDNISAKYDTSAMKLNKFQSDKTGITGSKSNIIASEVDSFDATSGSREIYFVFKEGSAEPFLMRQDMTDAEFKNLEKSISKSE